MQTFIIYLVWKILVQYRKNLMLRAYVINSLYIVTYYAHTYTSDLLVVVIYVYTSTW